MSSLGTSYSWKLQLKKHFLDFYFPAFRYEEQEKERNFSAVHTQYTERRMKDGFGIKTGSKESFTQCLCLWPGEYFQANSLFQTSGFLLEDLDNK